jgi:hypothetical protein
MKLRHPENPKIAYIRDGFWCSRIEPYQKVVEESSMRRDDIQRNRWLWISVTKGTHTTQELFYLNSSKYAFALQ